MNLACQPLKINWNIYDGVSDLFQQYHLRLRTNFYYRLDLLTIFYHLSLSLSFGQTTNFKHSERINRLSQKFYSFTISTLGTYLHMYFCWNQNYEKISFWAAINFNYYYIIIACNSQLLCQQAGFQNHARCHQCVVSGNNSVLTWQTRSIIRGTKQNT